MNKQHFQGFQGVHFQMLSYFRKVVLLALNPDVHAEVAQDSQVEKVLEELARRVGQIVQGRNRAIPPDDAVGGERPSFFELSSVHAAQRACAVRNP